MNDINHEDIIKIKNEIKILLVEIEKRESNLIERVEKNTHDILIYKSYLEDVIEKYHFICKQIYS